MSYRMKIHFDPWIENTSYGSDGSESSQYPLHFDILGEN